YFDYNLPPDPRSTLFPYTTLFRSLSNDAGEKGNDEGVEHGAGFLHLLPLHLWNISNPQWCRAICPRLRAVFAGTLLYCVPGPGQDRKSTRLNSSHVSISYAVFCLK